MTSPFNLYQEAISKEAAIATIARAALPLLSKIVRPAAASARAVATEARNARVAVAARASAGGRQVGEMAGKAGEMAGKAKAVWDGASIGDKVNMVATGTQVASMLPRPHLPHHVHAEGAPGAHQESMLGDQEARLKRACCALAARAVKPIPPGATPEAKGEPVAPEHPRRVNLQPATISDILAGGAKGPTCW